MAYKIPEILAERKVVEGALVLGVFLFGGIAFGLGRLSVPQDPTETVALCDTIPEQNVAQTAAVARSLEPTGNTARNTPSTTNTAYVASKSGSVYHLPWCSGAKRIKEENKVYFSSKADAEAAGYRPASNCKGL